MKVGEKNIFEGNIVKENKNLIDSGSIYITYLYNYEKKESSMSLLNKILNEDMFKENFCKCCKEPAIVSEGKYRLILERID
jgi:hypothetical protein